MVGRKKMFIFAKIYGLLSRHRKQKEIKQNNIISRKRLIFKNIEIFYFILSTF